MLNEVPGRLDRPYNWLEANTEVSWEDTMSISRQFFATVQRRKTPLRCNLQAFRQTTDYYIFKTLKRLHCQGQEGLDHAAEIFSWNKRLMAVLGLWPLERSNLRFTLNFGYFTFLMILEYLDLFLFVDNLEHVIMNLTENMAFSQIFVRMSMLWIYNNQLGELIVESMKDFDFNKYETIEETKIVIAYNAKSKTFVKLLMLFVALTASSYYLTPLFIILGGGGLPRIVIDNVTEMLYLLPYRFHTIYEVQDLQSYSATYVVMFPFVFVSGFGQSAADCIMVTLVFHICGQMATLARRINKIRSDPSDCRKDFQQAVRMHTRLLRMGKAVEEAFSTTLLAHLIGATSLVCILGYQILTNFAKGEIAVLGTFVTFQFLVLLILYAHCTVGENLVTESARVCQAFYDCEWYNMSIKQAKCIIICIARSQKPLGLTAGKFGTFCLSTLTDTIKTSMAYLSVLRSFLT